MTAIQVQKVMSNPTDMHIQMTVMTWSNTITKKINKFVNVNWEINEKLILRNGQNWAHLKHATIFTEKEKKFRKSAILTKLKFSVQYVIVFLALFLRGEARTGTASVMYKSKEFFQILAI